MILGVGGVVAIDFLTEILYYFFGVEFLGIDPSGGYFVIIAMIVLIGYLGYYGVNQSKILLPNFLLIEVEELEAVKEEKKRSVVTNFSPVEIEFLENNLRNVFANEKPFLDEDLTLSKLAGMVDVTDKKLSTFLNQHLGTTFYDIINKERVDVVKEKLQSSDFEKLTLLGIAYESGFKSKSSFNRIFKKETGLSPSEYRKQFK